MNFKYINRRRRIGARKYKDYSQEMLELAVDIVKKRQMTSREAEKSFGIPRRTILNKINKKHVKPPGGQQKLSIQEEEKLVNVLIASSNYGRPMTKIDVKILVFKYLEKNSRTDLFCHKLPSDAWIDGFLNRHRTKLTIRITQNIKQSRAEKGMEEMENFYVHLQETLKNVAPTNILNFDETSLSDNPGTSKCIFKRGIKYPERIINNSKSSISIMFTATAAGLCLPTYVVYKSKNLYSEWVEGGPSGTRYNCSKSGWFDTASFEDYLKKKTIVVEWAKQLPGIKVVIGDNLSSHINIEVVELCEKYNIKMVFLPPNSTHLTQPLDVAYFGPLKKMWKKILLDYKINNPRQITLNKKHFPKLLNELLENMKHKNSQNIVSGFRATGIWPINPRNVFKRLPEYTGNNEYDIDRTLLDYLKETRSPNVIQAKRSKKLQTQPGKSVSVDDILIKTKKSVTKQKKASATFSIKNITKKRQAKDTEVIMTLNTENEIYLDEVTGKMIRADETIKIDGHKLSSDSSDCVATTSHTRGLPVIYSPSRLDMLCIDFINMQIMYDTITHRSEICVLNKNMKNHETNQSFIAFNENNIPRCLRPKTNEPNVIITSNIKITPKKINEIKKKVKGEVKRCRKALQMNIVTRKRDKELELNSSKNLYTINDTKINANRTSKRERKLVHKERIKKSGKQKKVRSYSETSETEISDILSVADTDQSEFETFDEYIETCLKEIDDKENLKPPTTPTTPHPVVVPFGLNDISYFTCESNLREDDWVIVKFATKKSLKHFVGCVLSVRNYVPTVKFARKVKNSKDGKMIFTYPNVEDVCEVNRDDVEVVLPKPNISRRGQIMFDISFNPTYNIQ